MNLSQSELLGTKLGKNISVKEITLGQVVKKIPCFGIESEDIYNVYDKMERNLPSKATIKNLNIKSLPVLKLKLSKVYGCNNNQFENNWLYLWYVFTDGKDEYNIIKKYYLNKANCRNILGIDISGNKTTKYFISKGIYFTEIYNPSKPTLSYNDIMKCVPYFCIRKGEEAKNSKSVELSDTKPDVCNEYLKPKQEATSSYEWGEVKCSYEQDGKKYNKILNKNLEELWDDMNGLLSKASINFDKSYIKCVGFNRDSKFDVKTFGTDFERQAGDNIFETLIVLNDTKTPFKNLSISSSDLQIDILNSLKNGNVKKLIENTNIIGTTFYKGLDITKHDEIIEYNASNVANLLTVFGVPFKRDIFKGEKYDKINDEAAKYKNVRYEKGYGYIFNDINEQSSFSNNTNKKVFDTNFADFLKVKCDRYAESLNAVFKNTVRRLYNTSGKTYLAGTNMENAGVIEFLNVVLLMMLTTENPIIANNICSSLLKSGIDKDTQTETITGIFKSILKDAITERYKSGYPALSSASEGFNFNSANNKSTVAKMLISEVDKIKSIEKKNEKPKNLKNVEFSCVCKAKRRIQIWSLSRKFNEGNFKGYRFATILPYEEPLQDISENDYEGVNIQQVEDFIQTWMVKPSETKNNKPAPVPIEGYYDMLSGMTPYVEYSFRESVNSMENEIKDGEEYVLVKKSNDNIHRYKKETDGCYYEVKLEKYENEKPVYEKITGAKSYSYKELTQSLVNSFKKFDSVRYPYFKNLSIEDTGVKKITLTLFDPDFGSFNLDRNGSVFSLESVIRGALRNPYFEKADVEDDSSYDASIDYSGGIESGYLDIKEGAANLSPTNLKIRFGYTKDDNITNQRSGFKDRFASRPKKNARWWDEEQIGSNTDVNIVGIKKYIKDKEIQNQEGSWQSIDVLGGKHNTSVESNSNDPHNELGGNLSVNAMLDSPFQTTVLSREYNFMIIGFNTEFTVSGIQYTIQAIESKDAVTLKTRFLQRYTELTANPEEVLYNLMHIFNEDNEGKNIEKSKVKICLVEDVDDNHMKNILNMKYDFKKMKNEKLLDNTAEVEDLYSAACFDNGITYNSKYLKDITLKFGSEEAIKNYNSNRGKNNPPLYKTVAQLMNEFCASCPPKIEKKWKNVKDENGQSIISDNGTCAARPLKWFTFEDTINEIVYICLYYRRTKKVKRIRVYTWGPHNPTLSCVKSVNLKNSNEFAILSAVDAFKTSDGIIPRDTCMTAAGTADISAFGDKNKKISPVGYESRQANIAGAKTDEYLNAFSSSMYNVSMEVLGDPSLCFDGEMQPYTYPIELNLLMPQNEFTRKALSGASDVNGESYGKLIEGLIKKNMSRFSSWYRGTAWYKSRNNVDEIKTVNNSNQILHEASGYYVVSKITHELNSSGFKTSLELVSYPNIAADVIGGIREQWERDKNKS